MGDLPTGAVTFLFTDIEGSTRLVRRLRERYPEVLAEHQRLVRAAFARHGGHEIDTQGDAFFYAFGSAQEAVLAAVEAQRALSGHPWPDEAELKVRMEFTRVRPRRVNGRYAGLAVHRAARICAAGHGGQILVSQATQSLIEDDEEHLAVGLRDLGEQRLKDIDRPVRLYQVAASGLATEFPAVRGEADAVDELQTPVWRRRSTAIAAGVVIVAAAVAVAVFLTTRGTSAGLSRVPPNHVGIIDPGTNRIVAAIPVGIRPGPLAVGGGAVWVGNLDERTLTKLDSRRRTPAGTFPAREQDPDRHRRRSGVGLGSTRGARTTRCRRSRVRNGGEDDRRGRRSARVDERASTSAAAGPSGRCTATRRSGASTPAPLRSQAGR